MLHIRKTQTQKGFTLIELMIVIVIIGILAAIAIPAYLNYTKKARVTEGISLMGPLKQNVVEFYTANGAMPASNAIPDGGTSDNVSSVAYTKTSDTVGVVTTTFTSEVENGATLILTGTADSNGQITWACSGSLSDDLKPGSCNTTT